VFLTLLTVCYDRKLGSSNKWAERLGTATTAPCSAWSEFLPFLLVFPNAIFAGCSTCTVVTAGFACFVDGFWRQLEHLQLRLAHVPPIQAEFDVCEGRQEGLVLHLLYPAC